MPDADDFRALARSSPWRWATLRFSVRWRGEHALPPVRAWLRRPDVVRVESLDGHLLQVVREPGRHVVQLGPDGGRETVAPWPADGPPPVRRPDGLVAERPEGLSYDAPMYQSYSWVAVLDPVELADGRDPGTGERTGPGLDVAGVAEVEHGGRPAWEAVVRPTPLYEPRCGCCPLLRSRLVDRSEWGEDAFADAEYPTEYLVRLDAQTGVCVWTEALDGTWVGTGHVLRIEAVDEPMPDALFG